MKARKFILISLVVLIVAFVGLHLIAGVGAYWFSRFANREATAKIEVIEPVLQPAASAPETNVLPTYTVKKGDTLAKIARVHGVSREELCKLNKIEDPDRIQLAQVLQLPRKN